MVALGGRPWRSMRLSTMLTLLVINRMVLTAFQQIEDSLSSLRLLTQQIEQQRETVASAQRHFDIAIARYKTGLDPYLNVFTAQSALLANQQTMIDHTPRATDDKQCAVNRGFGWWLGRHPAALGT